MKKAISLALAALIATVALGITAFAAGEPTMTLESKNITKDTTTVTLNLTVSNYPVTTNMGCVIESLPTGVTFTKLVDKTAATFTCFSDTNDTSIIPFTMAWNGGANGADPNGVIAELTFAIAGPLEVGDEIKIAIAGEEDLNVDANEAGPENIEDIVFAEATLKVVLSPEEQLAQDKEDLKAQIEDLIENGDLDAETIDRLNDILDQIDDASRDQIDALLDIFADVNGEITEDQLAAAEKALKATEESSEVSGEETPSTPDQIIIPPTGETAIIAAAVATVALAGAAIVALKKRK
jgi:hypothetical protein